MHVPIRIALFWIIACPGISQELAPSISGNPPGIWIQVDVSEQSLSLFLRDSLIRRYPVSTSKFGIGNLENSFQTPLGWHRIREKIGQDEPIGAIFTARKSTQKQAVIFTDSTDAPNDLITTRILRLEGCEPGFNQGGNRDSYHRCIYIHGTQEEGLIGSPASHGCIRMKNKDIIDLFNRVNENIFVKIVK
jgi:hypothetical protein